MQQTVKVECDFRLYELKKAVTEFLEFTENLTLFQAVNDKAQEIVQAVDVLQMVLKQDLSADELFSVMNATEAASLLEEIVDVDAVSELKEYVQSASENLDDAVVARFLAEVMEKVDLKYNRLLEKAHAFNELLKD
ncbi:MAG: hypothetical protein PHF31_16970 [Methylobacter sp.]|nr:hypothetical protein [Methylobacter sp.]